MCFVVFDVGFSVLHGCAGLLCSVLWTPLYGILSCFAPRGPPTFLQFGVPKDCIFVLFGVLPFCVSAAGGVGVGGVEGVAGLLDLVGAAV